MLWIRIVVLRMQFRYMWPTSPFVCVCGEPHQAGRHCFRDVYCSHHMHELQWNIETVFGHSIAFWTKITNILWVLIMKYLYTNLQQNLCTHCCSKMLNFSTLFSRHFSLSVMSNVSELSCTIDRNDCMSRRHLSSAPRALCRRYSSATFAIDWHMSKTVLHSACVMVHNGRPSLHCCEPRSVWTLIIGPHRVEHIGNELV
jgi:hypothetical protein